MAFQPTPLAARDVFPKSENAKSSHGMKKAKRTAYASFPHRNGSSQNRGGKCCQCGSVANANSNSQLDLATLEVAVTAYSLLFYVQISVANLHIKWYSMCR